MSSFFSNRAARFGRDEKGTIHVIFGLMAVMVVMFVGAGVDIGRAVHSNAKLSFAMDAAALAAAKGIRLEGLSDAEAKTLAQNVFDVNLTSSGGNWIDVKTFNITLDRASSTAKIDVSAAMKTSFMGIAGINEIALPKTAEAIFDLKDIEVSVQLDLTGSMCSPCSKIAALRTSTSNLLDVLLPDGGTPNKVRVALAPFAQSVNAGALAGPVTNNRSKDGCVYESEAVDPNTDALPGSGTYMKVAGDPGVTRALNVCPSGPKVIPLTSDKAALKNEVAKYATYNSTAGHLGTAWAWYMLSPNWASILPSASTPVAYNDAGTTKVAILMTDGVYNTVGGTDLGDVSSTSIDSQSRAKTMCDNMKREGITVYTVGFDLSQIPSSIARTNAIDMLKACATDPSKYYQAETASDLDAAFKEIGTHIMSLRLSM